MKSILNKLDDAAFLRAFHGWATVFWLPFTLVSFLLGWLESVVFVSLISMLALFLGSFSSWQASRAEVKIDEESNTARVK